MTRRDRVIALVFAVGTLLLAASAVGIFIPGLDVAFHLVVGWAPFLKRVLPQLQVRWDLVGSTAVYLSALVVGTHLFLRWLYREMRRADGADASAWKWRWTLGGQALVLLMFVAGTAMVGIAHQTAWLARSPEPLYRRGGRMEANRIKCQSNLRQIGQGLQMYAGENGGRLPDDLRALLLTGDFPPYVFVCPAGDDEHAPGDTPAQQAAELLKPGHCSYVYLAKGLSEPVNPKRVVVVERLENHEYGINVLRADGTVEWRDRPAAEELLAELGFERLEPKKP